MNSFWSTRFISASILYLENTEKLIFENLSMISDGFKSVVTLESNAVDIRYTPFAKRVLIFVHNS